MVALAVQDMMSAHLLLAVRSIKRVAVGEVQATLVLVVLVVRQLVVQAEHKQLEQQHQQTRQVVVVVVQEVSREQAVQAEAESYM
jgi:hypothetical protein